MAKKPLFRFHTFVLTYPEGSGPGIHRKYAKGQDFGMPVGSECRPSDTDWNGPSGFVIVNQVFGRDY